MAVTKTDWSKPASDPANQPASDEVYQDAIMRAAADMYMASPQTDPAADALQTLDRMQSTIDASKARDAERYRLEVESAILLDNIIAEEAKKREAARMMSINNPLGMGMPSPASDAAAFRAREAALASSMGMNQGLAGFDAYQAMLSDAAAAARANIAGASEGLLGAPTRFMNERFLKGMGTRIGDRDSEAYNFFLSDPNLFSPVYNAAGRLTGYRDQYGRLTGTDPIADAAAMGAGGDDQPEVTSTVTNPATGREECPDGYIFDPDLNACRLDTRGDTTTAPDAPTTPVTPGEMYARTGLLDVAPEGLMGFRERYGAGFGTPSDFGAANLAFRQQAAISPEYFQTPPKLTGYTLL